MAKEIVWTKRANNKFTKIIQFLEEDWGHLVTENFVQRTYTIIDLLAEQPQLGTLENVEKQIRGFVLTKHNRLFYRITENEIILLNFFDTRSKPKRR
jgi:plasmid stabilization system protein ParE